VIPTEKSLLFGSPMERAKGILRLWARLGFERYDLCATLYYDRRYSFLTLPVRARSKVVLSRKSRKATLIGGRNHTNEYIRILLRKGDGYCEENYSPIRPDRLPLSLLPDKIAVRRIAIVPGGAPRLVRQQIQASLPEQAVRRWPIEGYVMLARQLLDRGWEVVLLGGPEDAWAKAHFQQLGVTDCIGALSLPEVISACDACDGVISHDTGPLHLAGLSRACLVGIFGPTDPSTFLPRRPSVAGIWGGQGFACRPCYDGHDFAPCQFNGCMHQVTPELVLRELDRLLSERSLGISSPWRIVFPDERPSLPSDNTLVTLT
jgi:heptosyltransferase-2